MNLYEHEAADIFSGFGIRVPERILAATPDEALMAAEKIGIISRSGTLSYEMAGILSSAGYGQSTVVGKGADPITLTNLSAILQHFDRDPATTGVVIVGEVDVTILNSPIEVIDWAQSIG